MKIYFLKTSIAALKSDQRYPNKLKRKQGIRVQKIRAAVIVS
jgi:hypothetical protein